MAMTVSCPTGPGSSIRRSPLGSKDHHGAGDRAGVDMAGGHRPPPGRQDRGRRHLADLAPDRVSVRLERRLGSVIRRPGMVTPSSPDFVEDAVIAAQPNGKVLIGGTAPVAGSLFDFVLVRLLQDGRLDASFGLDGVTTVDVGGRTNGLGDLIIGRRGRIIAGGTVVRTLPPPPGSPDDINQATMVVVRLLEDGTVDSRFGRGGRTIVRFFPGVDDQYKSFHFSSIAAQSDGSLVLGGGGYLPNGGRVAVFGRLRRNGELDKRFGTRGRLIPQIIPKIDGVADLIIDGLDRIYASVWVQQRGAPHSEAGVLRVLPDGVLDQRFGSNGVAAVGLRRETDPRDLDLTQGHLVLGGSALGGKRWGWDFALFAFRV